MANPIQQLDFSAVITAGGQSRRFGSDKALALWQGRTLLECVAHSFGDAPERLLIASAGRYALPKWTVIADERPGEGPLAGLETALQASTCEWVAFAGVDLPTLTAGYWRRLAEARTADSLSVQAADAQGQPQPLAALYHRDLLPHITALLGSGERRLRLACPTERAAVVQGLPVRYFWNINRPEDLAALTELGL